MLHTYICTCVFVILEQIGGWAEKDQWKNPENTTTARKQLATVWSSETEGGELYPAVSI